MTKNTRMLGLALALAVSPLALSSAWAADKIKVGLAVANLQADFFNQIKQSVEKNAEAMGAEVITVDAKGDGARKNGAAGNRHADSRLEGRIGRHYRQE